MLSLASPPAGAAVDGSSDRSARDRRLHTRQIPLLRLAGFGLLSLIALWHGLDRPQGGPLDGWLGLVALNLGYALASWTVLVWLHGRTGRFDLTLLFHHLDIAVWLVTVHAVGGSPLLLVLLMLWNR